MPSFTRTWVQVFWLVCAACMLLPGIAAADSSSSTTDSQAIYGRHRIPNGLIAPALRYADSTDDDSDSGERATASQLALLRISAHTPCLEDAGAPVDRGTLAFRIVPFVSRVAPRPPPPPRLL
jgi:hypothetical protein